MYEKVPVPLQAISTHWPQLVWPEQAGGEVQRPCIWPPVQVHAVAPFQSVLRSPVAPKNIVLAPPSCTARRATQVLPFRFVGSLKPYCAQSACPNIVAV